MKTEVAVWRLKLIAPRWKPWICDKWRFLDMLDYDGNSNLKLYSDCFHRVFRIT
jgi:hypothetical protein